MIQEAVIQAVSEVNLSTVALDIRSPNVFFLHWVRSSGLLV